MGKNINLCRSFAVCGRQANGPLAHRCADLCVPAEFLPRLSYSLLYYHFLDIYAMILRFVERSAGGNTECREEIPSERESYSGMPSENP